MGFGSYDESEQRDQSVDEDDESEGVTVHEHDHDGSVTVEGGDSEEALLDQLQTIKANADDDEE